MGYILLAFVVICTLVEVLIGIKRGIAFTGVRLILCVIGTVIAVLISKSVTNAVALKVAAGFDLEGTTLAEIMRNFLAGTALSKLADSLSVPFAAWTLSALIPFVFSILFILFKLLTWGIYAIVKLVLTKSSIAAFFTEKNTISKVAGGILGGLIGIYACALVLSPVSCLVETVKETGASDSLFHIIAMTGAGQNAAKAAREQAIVQLAIKLDDTIPGCTEAVLDMLDMNAVEVYASEEGSDGPATYFLAGVLGSDNVIEEIYDSLANSPSTQMCTVVGAQALAEGIYEGSSTVEAETVGGAGNTYNFPEAVQEVLGVADKVDETLVMINEGAGLSTELISNIGEIVDYALDSPILSEGDKLAIVNASVDTVQEMVGEAIGLTDVKLFDVYDDMDSLRNDIEGVMGIAQVVSSMAEKTATAASTSEASGIGNGIAGTVSGGILGNVDVGLLITDAEFRYEFLHSSLMLSNGAETIAALVNDTLTDYIGGEYGNLINTEAFVRADETEIINLIDIAVGMADYIGRKTLSEEEINDFISALDRAEQTGLVNTDAISGIRAKLQ